MSETREPWLGLDYRVSIIHFIFAALVVVAINTLLGVFWTPPHGLWAHIGRAVVVVGFLFTFERQWKWGLSLAAVGLVSMIISMFVPPGGA